MPHWHYGLDYLGFWVDLLPVFDEKHAALPLTSASLRTACDRRYLQEERHYPAKLECHSRKHQAVIRVGNAANWSRLTLERAGAPCCPAFARTSAWLGRTTLSALERLLLEPRLVSV